MELSLFVFVLALAYANGTNDVSKAIATLVGSGVANYRSTVLWGAIWTTVGAAASGVVAGAMLNTFSTGLLQPGVAAPPALTGALVGGGLVAFGSDGLAWPAITQKIALPLLLSPVLALSLSFVLYPAIRVIAGRWEGACLCVMPASRALVSVDAHGNTRTLFQASTLEQPVVAVPAQCDRAGLQGVTVGLDTIHWISSGLTSLGRGVNDAPKILARLLLGGAVAAWPSDTMKVAAFAGAALAMGLGSFIGGYRVTEVLAEKVTRMDHVEGLSANLTTSSLVLVRATLGLPVSTTHVSSSAIIGIGLLKGLRAVRWATVRDMVLAWLVTLPVAGILAGMAYVILRGWPDGGGDDSDGAAVSDGEEAVGREGGNFEVRRGGIGRERRSND